MNETTIFVIANERFGETQIFAADELERAIIEMELTFGDEWNEEATEAFRDAAEYYDMADDDERAEFDEYYGDCEDRTPAATEIRERVYADIIEALRTLRSCTGNKMYGISDEEAAEHHLGMFASAGYDVDNEKATLKSGKKFYEQGYRLHTSTQRWMMGHAHTIQLPKGCIYHEIVDCGYIATSPQKTFEYLTFNS